MNMKDLPEEFAVVGTERRFFIHTPSLAVIEYALTVREILGSGIIGIMAVMPPRLPLMWRYPGAVKVLDFTFGGPHGEEAWLEYHRNPFFRDLWLATVLPEPPKNPCREILHEEQHTRPVPRLQYIIQSIAKHREPDRGCYLHLPQ